jgi:hypothetical protein
MNRNSSSPRSPSQLEPEDFDLFEIPVDAEAAEDLFSMDIEELEAEASEEEEIFDEESAPRIPRPAETEVAIEIVEPCVVLEATGVDIWEWVIDKARRGEAPYIHAQDFSYIQEKTDKFLVDNNIIDNDGNQKRYTSPQLRQKFDNARNRLRKIYKGEKSGIIDRTGYMMPEDNVFFKPKASWGVLPLEAQRSRKFFTNDLPIFPGDPSSNPNAADGASSILPAGVQSNTIPPLPPLPIQQALALLDTPEGGNTQGEGTPARIAHLLRGWNPDRHPSAFSSPSMESILEFSAIDNFSSSYAHWVAPWAVRNVPSDGSCFVYATVVAAAHFHDEFTAYSPQQVRSEIADLIHSSCSRYRSTPSKKKVLSGVGATNVSRTAIVQSQRERWERIASVLGYTAEHIISTLIRVGTPNECSWCGDFGNDLTIIATALNIRILVYVRYNFDERHAIQTTRHGTLRLDTIFEPVAIVEGRSRALPLSVPIFHEENHYQAIVSLPSLHLSEARAILANV